MTLRRTLPIAAALMLTGCGDDTAPRQSAEQNAADTKATGTTASKADTPAPAATLTEQQLLDADLIDTGGRDLGDVEAVERDAGGAITHLVVEIDDTNPDRFVRLSVAGLVRVAEGDDWDVRGQYTRDQLMALPEVPAQPGW